MKRIIRKGASLILFMAMVINSFSYLPIYAQENNVGNEDTTTQIEDSENNAEESISSEDTLSPEEGEGSISMNEESAEETKTSDNVVIADEEPIPAPVPGDTSLVNYFYVGYPYLQAPSTQEFVLSFGNGTENISKIVLKYQKDNGNLVELQSSKQSGELYVFEKEFAESDSGTYKVIGFSYYIDSQEYTIDFSDLEMDVRFGVNQEYDGFGENEGYAIDSNGNEVEESTANDESMTKEIESSVVSLDGSNVSNTEDLVESVLKNNVQTPQTNSRMKRSITTYSESNPLVICIDPGHGGSESGTVVVDGSLEKNMNLKIAMYLKEELEQYKNVKVVMTRTSDVYVSLQDRARIAANAGATALVSIHINATGWGTQSSISGAEVYYPHANYNAAVSETGKNLAQNILNELVGLGLNNLGIKVKYVYDTNTGQPAHDPAYDYPDGSVGDYYGVIRYSKELGVAGIIVEHAMSDNWNDFNNFLSSDAKLKNLGVADATGIAKAFGLSKVNYKEIDELANLNKDVLSDGTYSILTELNTTKCIGVENQSFEQNTAIEITDSNGNKSNLWYVSHDKQGYVLLKNALTNLYMGISQSTQKGKVIQTSDNTSRNSKWIAINENGKIKLLSATNDALCLDVPASNTSTGTNLIIYQKGTGNNQYFKFNKENYEEVNIDDLAQENINLFKDGTYEMYNMINTEHSLGLNLDNKKYPEINGNKNNEHGWRIIHDSQGFVMFENVQTGKVLDISSGKIFSGNKVILYNKQNSKNQKWVITRNKNSYSIISAMNPNIVMAISENSLVIQVSNNSLEQKWMLNSYIPIKEEDELANQNRNVLQDGTYAIETSLAKDKVLDVSSESKEENAKVILYERTGGSNQYWIVSHDSKGYVTFTNKNSGKKLGIIGSKAVKSSTIGQQGNSQESTKWIVVPNGNGYRIVSGMDSRYSIDLAQEQTANKSRVILYENSAGGNQKWNFKKVQDTQLTLDELANQNRNVLQDGTYAIETSLAKDKVLDVSSESKEENAKVILYERTGGSNQYWIVSHDSKGYVTFTNKNSGKKLGIIGSKAVKSSTIGQQGNSQESTKWIVVPNGNGYRIVSGMDSRYSIDLAQEQTANKSRVILYENSAGGNQKWNFKTINIDSSNGYLIMGSSNITASQLVRYYNTYKGSASYDKFSGDNSKYNGVLAKGGASTIEEFCQIYYEECLAEGVKPEVAFAQSMLETGFLKFGGDVLPNQYNFAGLGATGNGVHGNSFSSVRIGIRAHIQHLKCYASTAPLNQEKVDPRWSDSLRGKAPTVEKLQGTWATSTTYASSLLKAIEKIKTV